LWSAVGFLAFFVTHLNSTRVRFLRDYLNQTNSQHGWVFPHYFVDYSSENTTDIPNLAVTEQYRGLAGLARHRIGFQPDLLAKYFFLFNFVVYETNARWIYRGADDSLMNLSLLRIYLRKLDGLFDPARDLVVRGNCVFRWHPFPQGGSGVLISRKAVMALAPLGRESIAGMMDWEDSQFGWMLERIGLTVPNQTASRAFLGVGFGGYELDIIRSRASSKLRVCPRIVRSDPPKCPVIVAPVREVIFYHSSAGVPFRERLSTMQNMARAPKEIYWYQPYAEVPILCRAEGVFPRGWMSDQTI
jgi:hypothetical protein